MSEHSLFIVIRPRATYFRGRQYWKCTVGEHREKGEALSSGFASATDFNRIAALKSAIATWEQPKLQRSPLTGSGE